MNVKAYYFYISCKLSPETINIKCQSLMTGEITKNKQTKKKNKKKKHVVCCICSESAKGYYYPLISFFCLHQHYRRHHITVRRQIHDILLIFLDKNRI